MFASVPLARGDRVGYRRCADDGQDIQAALAAKTGQVRALLGRSRGAS